MLAAAGHLTDRDRYLVRLTGQHRVLTTDQFCALGSDSIITASEATRDIDTERITQSAAQYNTQRVAAPCTPRTRAEIARYFTELDLVDPGLVALPQWRATPVPDQQIPAYAAIARKR